MPCMKRAMPFSFHKYLNTMYKTCQSKLTLFNAKLEVCVVNGSPGTFYSLLCPIDRKDFDFRIAIARREQPNNCLAGIVIDIDDTPLGVYLTCPDAVGEFSKPVSKRCR
jgi:hypothetical protein